MVGKIYLISKASSENIKNKVGRWTPAYYHNAA